MADKLPWLVRMKCLWPSTKTAVCCAAVALLTLVTVIVASGSELPSTTDVSPRKPLAQPEKSLSRTPAHIAQFAPVAEPLALPKCGSVHPPEELATPDPLFYANDGSLDVSVNFIVGADGHVHSAFVMESGGPRVDQSVLRAIRLWRYRPALCNGVPTDSETSVRFRLR